MGWVVLGIAVAAAVYGVAIYNRLVKLKQLVNEGWSGIAVQLKRRADLVPNLVETVQGYARHETSVFEKVTELRAQAAAVGDDHPRERAKVEGLLGRALANVIAVAAVFAKIRMNSSVSGSSFFNAASVVS